MDVLLVSVTPDLAEMRALLRSAGHRIVDEIVQRRDRPHPRTFVGRGKLEEVRARVARGDVQVVVFHGELRPTMHHHLERELGVECYDRLRVILELFAQRAQTREAQLQVEFALLRYEVPLLREWVHEADVGERPGFMAGGEQRVDAYYETVKRRIKKIRDELDAIRKERSLRRSVRKGRGYHLAALAGYANAGKSSLLNALTGERVRVEQRMFSTLSTTTRAIGDAPRRVLLTDTVGLVDGIPFWMVEAFQATLEEIFEADLVLLLLDASDSEAEIRRKARLAARTLLPRIDADRVLPILSKADLLEEGTLEGKTRVLEDTEFRRQPLILSSETGIGLDDLREAVRLAFVQPLEVHLVLSQDPEGAARLHWLHENAEVVSAVHRPDRVEVVVRCRPRDLATVESSGRVVLRRDLSP